MEERLRESEARYRLIVENQTEFIVKWLPDGTRTFVNEHYCRLFGLTEDLAVSHGKLGRNDAFLQKPFTPLTLARKVRETLDQPR